MRRDAVVYREARSSGLRPDASYWCQVLSDRGHASCERPGACDCPCHLSNEDPEKVRRREQKRRGRKGREGEDASALDPTPLEPRPR